ncbi:MAG: hypothetical protein ACR2GQ_09745 [Gemmatimonadota bacterium]
MAPQPAIERSAGTLEPAGSRGIGLVMPALDEERAIYLESLRSLALADRTLVFDGLVLELKARRP